MVPSEDGSHILIFRSSDCARRPIEATSMRRECNVPCPASRPCHSKVRVTRWISIASDQMACKGLPLQDKSELNCDLEDEPFAGGADDLSNGLKSMRTEPRWRTFEVIRRIALG